MEEPKKLKWRVLYGDWSEASSESHKWEDIPYDNVQCVWIIFPGGTIRFSGVDKYCLQEQPDGSIRATWWKDENPEEKDPYYMMGRARTYHTDNSASDDTGYIPVDKLISDLPQSHIKRGKYVDEDTAKAMKIL